MTPVEACQMMAEADLICSEAEIQTALSGLARDITAELSDAYPVVLTVMGGGVVFTGQLLPLLRFPLEFDYVQVSRYGDATTGGALAWKVEPGNRVADRTVLVIDDILDEGQTLAEIRRKVLSLGATRCLSVVFADKQIGKPKPAYADFVGVSVLNRYVFGFGMDVRGAWRNLPAMYMLNESAGAG